MGFSSSLLKTEGSDWEKGTRFSTATTLICGLGLAMKPTSYEGIGRSALVSWSRRSLGGNPLSHTSSSSVGMFGYVCKGA